MNPHLAPGHGIIDPERNDYWGPGAGRKDISDDLRLVGPAPVEYAFEKKASAAGLGEAVSGTRRVPGGYVKAFDDTWLVADTTGSQIRVRALSPSIAQAWLDGDPALLGMPVADEVRSAPQAKPVRFASGTIEVNWAGFTSISYASRDHLLQRFKRSAARYENSHIMPGEESELGRPTAEPQPYKDGFKWTFERGTIYGGPKGPAVPVLEKVATMYESMDGPLALGWPEPLRRGLLPSDRSVKFEFGVIQTNPKNDATLTAYAWEGYGPCVPSQETLPRPPEHAFVGERCLSY